ncbi:hypothetical protein HMPREF0765_0746 [Sphingobacterium spiritivorum ATCC 33300]|uniref:Uncharacterized protein n=1 Tax=Sphingobacterium spiritivorum ATCC 33300 TaxID=525372 RepID=C2FTW4_SPHSI|nr:hypothetical protein [Sphingobacterium spiritivorum]EEI93594.1 hypothetical protein HMPREF0765_0746 [Sphingobacterium spiritivorum ATCC 33300]QQS95687.1 hypothetical protein I6J03_20300 [Sphingobacterium spiritivorum]
MAEITHQILDKKSIVKQVLIALVVGTILLVSAVLPAEYGIDPLGIGKATGFSKLYVGEANTETLASVPHKILQLENVGSGAEVPKPAAADNPAPATQLAERTDEVNVVIPAGKGLEYKVDMMKHGNLRYEWITDKGELYFDFHGEVKNNNNYFESYTIAYSNNMVGSLLAPFEGPQGWYFKNNSNEDITVKIRMKGQYLLKQ